MSRGGQLLVPPYQFPNTRESSVRGEPVRPGVSLWAADTASAVKGRGRTASKGKAAAVDLSSAQCPCCGAPLTFLLEAARRRSTATTRFRPRTTNAVSHYQVPGNY